MLPGNAASLQRARALPDSRVRADDEPRSSARHGGRRERACAYDASVGANLRATFQRASRPHGNAVGRSLPILADRLGALLPAVQPIHRDEPGPGRLGEPTGGIRVVELQQQRGGSAGRARATSCSVPGARAMGRESARGLSCPVRDSTRCTRARCDSPRDERGHRTGRPPRSQRVLASITHTSL